MFEKKEKIQTYMVRMMCDCGGELKSDGTVYPTEPPRYKHICDKCGKVEIIWNNCYPTIGYETMDEDDLK